MAGRFVERVVFGLAVAVFLAFMLLMFIGLAVAAVLNALTGPFVEQVRTNRWKASTGPSDALPGSAPWVHREQRVADLIDAIEHLPVERFDAFDPSGVVGWRPLYHAADGAPREVRTAVDAVRGRASRTVVERAEKDRPEAGGEDYTLHGAWFLYEPHWEASERAAAAGAVAILLEGHLDETTQADWSAGVARLIGTKTLAMAQRVDDARTML